MLNLKFHQDNFLPHLGIDLELNISEGEVLILLGENGIGKTTIARAIAKTLPELVYVEQSPLDHFYQREIGHIKKILESVRSQNIQKEWLDELWRGFELDKKESRFIEQVSGGEAQAIKLSLTLCRDSEVYLLDEPFQYLDQSKKEFLYGFMRKLQTLKKKIIVIEHNFDSQFPKATFLKLDERNGKIQQGKTWTT